MDANNHIIKATEMQIPAPSQDQIDVRILKDIQIHFPGDVYILAVWLVMKNRSRTTAMCRPRTLLLGLAGHLASLHGSDGTGYLSRDAVMNIFKRHGIVGNPALMLGDGEEDNELRHMIESGAMLLTGADATTVESSCDSESVIKQMTND